MLLKGLVFQTMPHATMVQAIAAELRKDRKDSDIALADIRTYLKTNVAIEKGNLKIGRLILDEYNRQRGCAKERANTRHFKATSVSINAKTAKARAKGETVDPKLDQRAAVLAHALFDPIIGKTLPSGETINGIDESRNSPLFRMVRISMRYYSHAVAYMLSAEPTAISYIVADCLSHGCVPHEAVLQALGAAVGHGQSVTFDRHTHRVTLDGEPITPMELCARKLGWKLQLLRVEITDKRLP